MAPPAPDTVELPALAARVQRAVDWLGDEERQVLWLRQGEDLPWSQIAERLGTGREEVAALLLDARLVIHEAVDAAEAPIEHGSQCARTRMTYLARLDGEPVDPEAMAAAREHAAGCADCTEARLALRTSELALGAWNFRPVAEPETAVAPVAAPTAVPAARPVPARPAPRRTGTARGRRPVAVAATLAAGAGAVALATGTLGGESEPTRAAEPIATPTRAPERDRDRDATRRQKPELEPERKARKERKKRPERRERDAKPAATAQPTATPTPTRTPQPTATPRAERRRPRAQRPEPTPTPTPRPVSTPTPRPVQTPTRAPTRTPTPRPTPIPGDPNGDIIPPP